MGILRAIKGLLWSPRREGREGEEAVARVLRRMGRRKGTVLQNVYLPRGDGGTAEVDLLWVTVKGIFVVEVKNYAGQIRGREGDRTWVRRRTGSRDDWGRRWEEQEFYNPIWQNRSHCRAVERALAEWAVPVLPVVVFSDRCSLGGVELDSDALVCPVGRLRRCLKRRWHRLPRSLWRRQVRALCRELEALEDGRSIRQQHRRQVRRERETVGVCPRCGGELVLRTVRFGPRRGRQFWGCSRFPWCRYTRDF